MKQLTEPYCGPTHTAPVASVSAQATYVGRVELNDDELAAAAAGDLNILALGMAVGSVLFAVVNLWVGTMGWFAAALAVAGTLTWTIGLLRRSNTIAAFVKIGFGFSGLAAPIAALAGIGLGLAGFSWGWAVLAGAAMYFGFALLGLEILERAAETGVIDPL